MTLSVSKTVSESVSTADSAKSASIVTDTVGNVWDLANSGILAVKDDGSGHAVLVTPVNAFNPPGVSFSDAKTAWLATRS